jgi:hypothetical protein
MPEYDGQSAYAKERLVKFMYQTPFLQSSFVRTTAHIASSVLWPSLSTVCLFKALGLPLSPRTSPDPPRSTILNSMACTARLTLWF